MIRLSYDPDAGTLYWYFTDIIAGSVSGEGEAAAALALDENGQIIGLEIELDSSITPADLVLALNHAEATHDREAQTLQVRLVDEEPAHVLPLDELAILDFDAIDRLLGCEVQPAATFALSERLKRIAPFIVDVDAEFEDYPEPADDDAEADADDTDDSDADVAVLDAATDAANGDAFVDEEAGDEYDSTQPPLVAAKPPAAQKPFTPPADYRSGFVTIVGRPNVGKSTLLNALLGQKVAIVSPKPQTTRVPIRGILSRPDAQVVFVDTPGIHDPRTRLSSFMVEQARRTIPDADVVCFVVDITSPPNRQERRIAALVRQARKPCILVLNKLDQRINRGDDNLQAYRELADWDMEVAISALRQKGLETLVDEITRRLPLGPPLYPTDQVTDQNLRERAAELVREQVLRFTEQEVPHSVAVEVEEWRDDDQGMYMRMTIYVEKDSQKGILIGAGGAMLKQIGSTARQSIQQLLGRVVFLDLWVKARNNWRDDPASLRWLGYSE